MYDAMNAYLPIFHSHIALTHPRHDFEQGAQHETFSLYICSSQVKGYPNETKTPAVMASCTRSCEK